MALPPGPRLPSVVQTAFFLKDPVGFLGRCRRRYGDVFRVKLVGAGKLAYVVDPALMKAVFAADRDVGLAGAARKPYFEPLVGSNSLLCTDGEQWQRQHRLLAPPLHGQAIERYRAQIAEIAAREVETWQSGRNFALHPRMQAITLEVILRVVFGIEDAGRLDQLRRLLPQLAGAGQWLIWLPPVLGPWLERFSSAGPLARPFNPLWRFIDLRRQVDAILYDEIARRRGNPETASRDDILSLLVEARDEDGRPMSDVELRDELVTLLEAGHETTATALAWAFERLLRHPRVLDRLLVELDSGDDGYLDAVVKETLRARPVVYDVIRLLTGPLQLGRHEIPAGWYVAPAIALAQRLPANYPEPLAFRPERFLEDGSSHQAWMPFGGGRRRCIGSQFALLEMKVVIPEVLRRVTLRAPDLEPEGERLKHVTLVPSRGVEVSARPRARVPQPA